MTEKAKNLLEPCLYCPGQSPPRAQRKRARLRDTRQNRQRELALWRHLGNILKKKAEEGGSAC